MPWVTINMMPGHSDEQKRRLHDTVTTAIQQSLGLPREYVRIQLVEMEPINHSIGGVAIPDMKK